MDALNDTHLTDPPDQKPPCECDVNEAKRALSDAVDEMMFSFGLELADGVSPKEAGRQIDDLIDRLVAPVGTCGECMPEREGE